MATWTLAPKEAMRTGIYLFLMVALTTDALQRYREMLPALKGRLANEVQLSPISVLHISLRPFQTLFQKALHLSLYGT